MHMYQVLENHHNNVEHQIAPVQQSVLEYIFLHIFFRFLLVILFSGKEILRWRNDKCVYSNSCNTSI